MRDEGESVNDLVDELYQKYGHRVYADSMTMRQHFAGLAMQSLLSNDSALAQIIAEEGVAGRLQDVIAGLSVQYSDALIAELSKPTTKEEK